MLKPLLASVLLVSYNGDTSQFTKWEVVKPTIYQCSGRGVIDMPALKYVNNKVNQIVEYQADAIDYWQPPYETWNIKRGDCEDYAILKMDLLARIFNVCDTELAISVVRLTGEIHALLKVQTPKRVFVLDNLNFSVLSEARYVALYKEVFVIGRRGWRKSP